MTRRVSTPEPAVNGFVAENQRLKAERDDLKAKNAALSDLLAQTSKLMAEMMKQHFAIAGSGLPALGKLSMDGLSSVINNMIAEIPRLRAENEKLRAASKELAEFITDCQERHVELAEGRLVCKKYTLRKDPKFTTVMF